MKGEGDRTHQPLARSCLHSSSCQGELTLREELHPTLSLLRFLQREICTLGHTGWGKIIIVVALA